MPRLIPALALAAAVIAPAAHANPFTPVLIPLQPIPLPIVACADLAIGLDAQRETGPEGNTRFVVRMRNDGVGDFLSTPGLQRVRLSISGPFGTSEVVGFDFHRLDSGDARTWSVTRPGNGWQATAMLWLHPLTQSDASLTNNECNGGNNAASAAM